MAVAPRAAAQGPLLPVWESPAQPQPAPSDVFRKYALQTLLGVGVAAKKGLPRLAPVVREARAFSKLIFCCFATVLDSIRDAVEALGIPVTLVDAFFLSLMATLAYKKRSALFAALTFIFSLLMSLGPQLLGYYASMDPTLRDHGIPCLRAFCVFVASFVPGCEGAANAFTDNVEAGFREAAEAAELGESVGQR